MKIGLMFYSLTNYGGSPKVFVNLAKELANAGNEIELYMHIYNPQIFDPMLKGRKNISIYYINDRYRLPRDSTKIVSRVPLLKDFIFGTRKLSGLVSHDLDVLIGMEAITHKAILESEGSFPRIWSVLDPPQYAFKDQIGTLYNTNVMYRIGLDLFSVYERRIVRRLDRVIVPSQIAKRAVDGAFGIRSTILRLGGVDTEAILNARFKDNRIKQVLGLGHDTILILSLGMFFPHRRYEDAIKAVVMLRRDGYNIHYVIAGSGETHPLYFNNIVRLVERLGASGYVTLLNKWFTENEVLRLYNDCDIFVFPNDTQTWGLAPLEAMAMQKPTIVTSGAGVSEVLKNGQTSIIIPPRSPLDLYDAIRKLVINPQFREQLSQAGKEFVMGQWSYKACANKLMDFLQGVKRIRYT